MERSADYLPSHRHPPIHPHHYAPTSPSTAEPTIEHGILLRHPALAWYVPQSFCLATFTERSLWSMLLRFFGWSRGPLHEPYGTTKKVRAPSIERCSPDGCPYSIQTVKGQSSRLSLRSPGNAKPDKDARHPGRSLRRWRVSLIVMG